MSLPKLVATDLDGTLVRTDGTVSPYTRRVLAALEERGVPVIFVTGRPLRWAREVFEHVGEHGLAIVANGALVWDVAADTARLHRPLEGETVLTIAEQVRTAVPGSLFAVERLDGFGYETDFMPHLDFPDDVRCGPLTDLLDAPVLKLLARHEEADAEAYWRRGQSIVGEAATVTWSSTGALLEISAPGVTKASTLAMIADELGVAAADVMAFGDMPNDLPMLTWAGRSYAMADAHPDVRACATALAPSHDEDGVARVLAGVFDL